MASSKIRLGIGGGDLAVEQWRSLGDVAAFPLDLEVHGSERTTDHSDVLIDRLLSRLHDGVVVPSAHLPPDLPDAIEIVAVSPRRTPLSALVNDDAILLDEFEHGASIGVQGPREAAQLLTYRPDLSFVVVAGTLSQRLRCLDEEGVDALVLPAAYAEWIGIQDRVSEILPSEVLTPVAGQGSLSLLARKGEESLKSLVRALNDPLASDEIATERFIVGELRRCPCAYGAALMRHQGDEVEIEAMIVDVRGKERLYEMTSGPRSEALALARSLADELVARHESSRAES
jgi:hydroxymethylbilane synthase